MHELSVTEGLLQIITDQVKGTDVSKVYRVHLVIGELASLVDESIQFYFNILSKGSIAEEAELVITKVAARFTCKKCGHVIEGRSQSYRCPDCGSNDVLVSAGEEFYIDSIEVEKEDD